ncbi:MAG: CocE/NonD family hydrolase [Bryobacteraceae bacterium]|nr:CocE/NonD family hydrolase [Bryobacteraceae bacterium]
MRFLSLFLLLTSCTQLTAIGVEDFVEIPMRDGVKLAANVFLPEKQQRSATLLIRTPYNKGTYLVGSYKVFLESGYSIVVQDVRGRYSSGGVFRPLVQEKNDGDDTLNWISRQPWSTGKVGMLGGSYLGIVQWQAALSQNPHLIAIFPVVSGSDEYRDRYYSRGGALKLGHRLSWIADNLKLPWPFRPDFQEYVRHVPLRTADRRATGRAIDSWQEALDHPSLDSYWRNRSTFDHLDKIQVPAFIVGGWYDNYVESDLDAFISLSRRSSAHRIVIGPWPHNQSAPYPSGISFGNDSGAPIRRYQLDWFHYWMHTPQPSEPFSGPRVRIFVMGANKWRDEDEWPLSRARPTSFYLTSEIGANSLQGDGRLSIHTPLRDDFDSWIHDPEKPVPTAGGAVCCDPKVLPWGPMDQRDVENRDDVLVYTSPPLKQDMEVTGPIRATLFVATSAPDTDYTAKLVDVFPDGHARNLCDGILRLRYRDGLSKPVPARPGEVYPVTIEVGVTSNLFRSGHRVRLEVASSNFPRFDRNSNTGRALANETTYRKAAQTVYHGRARPSRLILPVIPPPVIP